MSETPSPLPLCFGDYARAQSLSSSHHEVRWCPTRTSSPLSARILECLAQALGADMSLHISLPCAVVSSKLQIRCATPSWMACLCRQPGKTALLQRCAEISYDRWLGTEARSLFLLPCVGQFARRSRAYGAAVAGPVGAGCRCCCWSRNGTKYCPLRPLSDKMCAAAASPSVSWAKSSSEHCGSLASPLEN